MRSLQQITAAEEKIERLHDATQARVDATHEEIRAAISVIAHEVTAACHHCSVIHFELDEINSDVRFDGTTCPRGTNCGLTGRVDALCYEVAGLIARDEILTAGVAGLSQQCDRRSDWCLNLADYYRGTPAPSDVTPA